jgi:hypothetical protein
MENKEQNTGMQPDEETRVKIADAADDYRKQFNNLPAQRFNAFVAGALWQSSQPINSGWVSCLERLPEIKTDGEKVLLHRILNEGQKSQSISVHDTSMVKHCNLAETHWMPLPLPPKQ